MSILDDARAFRAKIGELAQYAPDGLILAAPEVFDRWKPDTAYMLGDVRRDGTGKLYRCLQSHGSQADWNPASAPALWTRIDDPAEEWPALRDPIPAENPYMAGDKVTYNGRRYICQIDNCVWTPDAYPAGWEMVA